MLFEPEHEFRWDRTVECFDGYSGVIARFGNDADLVLDLNHDDGMEISVLLLDVPHQCRKRASIGFLVLFGEWRQPLRASAVGSVHSWEALGVALDPLGHIARIGYLRASKQEKDEPQIIPASAVNQPIHDCEVEVPFARLD